MQRRMREFYRTYESAPNAMAEAMSIGWTQNVVILEAEPTLQERQWHIIAVQRFDWSKLALLREISVSTNLNPSLDF